MYEGETQEGTYTGTVDCFDPKFVPSNEWVALSTLREKNANFDAEWLLNMTLKGRDYGDYIQLWDKFDGVFGEVALLHRKEVMTDYLSHMFLELANDGLQYAEYRAPPIVLTDLQNNTYNFSYFIEMFKELSEEANFPGKLIYSVSRSIPADEALVQMKIAIQLMAQYPDVVVGFDLDGPEDEGHTLIYFIDQFLQINNESGNTMRYFFHAGETVFLNNTNLYDAILLNSTRIGHGFQLNKHPVLLDEVKARGICVEVCPISNQILELSPDIRTHPGFEYFNRGIPIVISSDDPSIYGYEGTSYDFYEAFMSWNLGLKQLAINSIECSIWSSDTEKQIVYQQWQTEWAAWIDSIVNDFS